MLSPWKPTYYLGFYFFVRNTEFPFLYNSTWIVQSQQSYVLLPPVCHNISLPGREKKSQVNLIQFLLSFKQHSECLGCKDELFMVSAFKEFIEWKGRVGESGVDPRRRQQPWLSRERRWKEQQRARSELLLQIVALFLNLLVSVAGLLRAFIKENTSRNHLWNCKILCSLGIIITPNFSSSE